jgi:HPt (histidine-containing phosphotransfer) domain-containing protein
MEDLRASFLPRFVEAAKSRLARARSLLEMDDAKTLARELHALAGEAKMLGLFGIAEDASRGEVLARAWSEGGGEDSRAACASCLDAVGHGMVLLSPPDSHPAGGPP